MRLGMSLQIGVFPILDHIGTPRAFSPLDLLPKAYFEGVDINGGTSAWSDESGNAHHCDVVSATKPTYLANANNGNAGLQCVAASSTFVQSASGVNLLGTGTGNAHAFTIGCVVKLNGSSGDNQFFFGNIGDFGAAIAYHDAAQEWAIFSQNVASMLGGTLTAGAFHIAIWRYDGAGTSTFTVDGSAQTLSSQENVKATGATGRIVIGAESVSGVEFSNSTILAGIILDYALDATQHSNLLAYWQAKQGL